MRFYTNIPKVIEQLLKVKAAVSGSGSLPPDFSDAMSGALNTGMGLMKQRIFNNSLDAQGNTLGKYVGGKSRLTKNKLSTKRDDVDEEKERKKSKRNLNRAIKDNPDEEYSEYEKKRLAAGRQIDQKDLQFNDSLFKSIEIVKVDNKVQIMITNTMNAKIARYQERQIANIRAGLNTRTGNADPAKIFILSREEFDTTREQGRRLIAEVINAKIKQP